MFILWIFSILRSELIIFKKRLRNLQRCEHKYFQIKFRSDIRGQMLSIAILYLYLKIRQLCSIIQDFAGAVSNKFLIYLRANIRLAAAINANAQCCSCVYDVREVYCIILSCCCNCLFNLFHSVSSVEALLSFKSCRCHVERRPFKRVKTCVLLKKILMSRVVYLALRYLQLSYITSEVLMKKYKVAHRGITTGLRRALWRAYCYPKILGRL